MIRLTLRRLRNFVLLLLGLAVGVALIRGVTPEPHLEHVTPKLTHLKQNPQAYDVLFVGSSRVFRQVSPKLFDRRMRHHGHRFTSFNAGIPAAKSAEVWHFLNRLGDDGKVRPRYVFIEPDGLDIGISRANVASTREVYWHGPEETALAIRSLGDREPAVRRKMTLSHLKAFMLNGLGVGRLRSLASDLGGKRSHRPARPLGAGPDLDGWVPFEGPTGEASEVRRKDFLDHLPRYRRLLREQPELLDEPDCMTAHHVEMLGRLDAAVRALGAEPVFILSPATKPRCEVHQAYREGLLPNLIAIDDARKQRRLYKVENRFDAEHLNREGAEIYTRLMADRFAEHLDGELEGGLR